MRLRSRLLLPLLGVVAVGVLQTPADAANNSFLDDDNSRYEPFIEAARSHGLAIGCNPPTNDRVCPHQTATRGDVAILLASATSTPAPLTDYFADDQGHPAEGAINGLMEAGAATSCRGDNYCPDRPVTRGEMADLIDRSLELRTADAAAFTDLEGSLYREPMARLEASGGLGACDPPVNRRLCPTAAVSRGEAIYAVVRAMGLQPGATAATAANLPPIGFADGFHHLSLWDGRTPSTRNNVAIASNGFSGTGLRVAIPKGSHYGSDFHLHMNEASDSPPEHLFFRYYLKLDPEWRATTSGKLPGFSGVYGSTGKGGLASRPSQPGWSARLMFSPNNQGDSRVGLGYYVYHLGQETRYGDGLYWNEAGKLVPGEWYCLEGEVKLNTPGVSNGVLRGWVDETPALDVSGIEFRRPNEPQIRIESFWFNVYYGGKPVSLYDLGLTIDEVRVETERIGCGAGDAISSPARGDFNGDGYNDQARWDRCPGGHCFLLERQTWEGRRVSRQDGTGAWFNLDSHRLGSATGDLDGDGRSDILYHGRCEGGASCWRAHIAAGGMGKGENWGGEARWSPATATLLLGDWDGDGRDDLVYQGLCGDGHECWRVHPNSGTEFAPPQDWGPSPIHSLGHVAAADVTGDGRDDLVYQAPCEESLCWFLQAASETSFGEPFAMGPVLETSENAEWIDFDGDSNVDLVSWANSDSGSWIEVRFQQDELLSEPVSLAALDRPITDVAMRRVAHRSTVQAVVETSCDDGKRCVERLMSPTAARLVDSTKFRDARWARLEVDID